MKYLSTKVPNVSLYGPEATVWAQGYEVFDVTTPMGQRQGQMVLTTQASAAEAPPAALVPMDAASQERQKLIEIGFRDESCALFTHKSAKPGRYLKPRPGYQGGTPSTHDPWRVADLYRRFAALDCKEESICEFADQFGNLGKELYWVPFKDDSEAGFHATYIEPIDRWIAEIVRLRMAILLSDLSSVKESSPHFESSISKLESLIGLTEFESEHYWPSGSEIFKESWFEERNEHQVFRIYFPHQSSGTFNVFNKGSSKAQTLQRIAKYFAKEQVNTELLFGVSPFITFEKNAPIRLTPRYLLAAMYVQFALDLTTRRYTPCAQCGTPIVGGRKNRQFCNDACRKRYSRAHSQVGEK